MATATLIKDLGHNGNAYQKLYKVSPKLEAYSWDDDDNSESYEYVIVSAANIPFSGPETYIFGADKDGEVIDWYELPGSFKGELDHNKALTRAGYTTIE